MISTLVALALAAAPAQADTYDYIDGSGFAYDCNWRFISGPRAGQRGTETRQYWAVSSSGTTVSYYDLVQGPGYSFWTAPTISNPHLTSVLTRWTYRDGSTTCNAYVHDGGNYFELRYCNNGAEMECTLR